MRAFSQTTDVAAQFGQKDFVGPQVEIVDLWQASTRRLLDTGGTSEPPDFKQWPCPLEDDTCDECDHKLRPIEPHGILPSNEADKLEYTDPDVEEACCTGFQNYTSVNEEYDEGEDGARTMDIEAGYRIEVSWDDAARKDPRGPVEDGADL